MFTTSSLEIQDAGRVLTRDCYGQALAMGWYTDLSTGNTKPINIGEKLMLCVSELAEGMEGARKNLMDDHLPHRKMLEVELADAAIRIFDLAGALSFDLGAAMAEKLLYNAERADHQTAARLTAGGKAF